jgi:hypothetical protein
MLSMQIVSACAVARTIALLSFGTVTACSGGDPASPSLPGAVPVGADAGAPSMGADASATPDADASADVLEDQAVETTVEAACTPGGVPNACPSPPPSWMNTVRIVIETRCSPCHFPDGVDDSRRDYSTYQSVHMKFGEILDSVATCQMPPPDAGQLTAAQRESLLAWLVCAAPDN